MSHQKSSKVIKHIELDQPISNPFESLPSATRHRQTQPGVGFKAAIGRDLGVRRSFGNWLDCWDCRSENASKQVERLNGDFRKIPHIPHFLMALVPLEMGIIWNLAPPEQFHHQNGGRSEGIVLGKSQSAPIPQSDNTHSPPVCSLKNICQLISQGSFNWYRKGVLKSLGLNSHKSLGPTGSMTIRPRKVSPESATFGSNKTQTTNCWLILNSKPSMRGF